MSGEASGRDGLCPSWRQVRWSLVALLLLLPLVAMAVTDAVAWGPGDFALAALLLGGACALYDALRGGGAVRRALLAGGLVLIVALVWIELAVGIL